MKKNHSSNPAIAGAAAVCAGLMVFIFLFATRAADKRALDYQLAAVKKPVSVVYATRHLSKGTLIRSEDVAYRKVPAAYLPAGFVGRKGDVIGRDAVSEIFAGEAVLLPRVSGAASRRASTAIRAGRVALAVGTDEISGVAGAIRAGDRVDVLVTEEEGGPTRLFLEDARVLGIGGVYPFTYSDDSGDSEEQAGLAAGGGTTVVLELTPAQAGRLTQASETGKVRLALKAAR